AAAFAAWAAQAGVRAPAWQVAEGSLPAVLRRLGNRHDLLLLARDAQSEEQRARLGAIVLECGMPVILVPAQATARLDCIAVSWNGSSEALRALQAARPLLARARRVVVLRGEIRDRYAEIGWLPPFDLEVYLQRHGIQAEYRGISGPESEAGRALLAAAREAGADLLVMGAYGRTRFSEWVFGGATRHVVAEAELPVLLRH
ncbi:universal stress protein, partial [Tahibacter caeni]|uniref:universal stress protein n=1 Tax=Tahibacter caeni TaxID=1453545 RepID=UPI002148BA7D